MSTSTKRAPLGPVIVATLALAIPAAALAAPTPGEPLKIGMIGLDTSHVDAFISLLNDPQNPDYIPGARVVAAYKGGSPDVEASATRIEKFTADVTGKWKIKLVSTIEELCAMVDAVIITSVDGRTHLRQVRPVFKAKKRVFIDKPLAGNLQEAREIVKLSRQSGTPFFTASGLRFADDLQQARKRPKLEAGIVGADSFGPADYEPHHPDLYWYGIHTVEILYTLMGPGCVAVSRTHTPDTDVVVGRWKDGRIGTMRGVRNGSHRYGAIAFGKKESELIEPGGKSTYRNLVVEIVRFFQTGVAPVAPEESLEVMAFMSAADVSKGKKGAEVPVLGTFK